MSAPMAPQAALTSSLRVIALGPSEQFGAHQTLSYAPREHSSDKQAGRFAWEII